MLDWRSTGQKNGVIKKEKRGGGRIGNRSFGKGATELLIARGGLRIFPDKTACKL